MQSVGQKKNKTHRKMPQCYNYKSVQYEVEPIRKINLNHESESYIHIYKSVVSSSSVIADVWDSDIVTSEFEI